MTKMLWILGGLVAIAAVLLLFASFRFSNIETPKYTVLRKIGEVEIRSYPSMNVAQTSLNSASFDSEGSNGFRAIASYIFGANESSQKIAMTAPVVMEMGDSSRMHFVMPSAYDLEALPRPNSSRVQILEKPAQTLAVLSYGGFSDDDKIAKHCEELKTTLAAEGIQTRGAYLYMGYNSPWDVVNRRNEVAIEVLMDGTALAH
ncbi:MAG: SOUL family heme-binding protein [Bacteroidia bacterium]